MRSHADFQPALQEWRKHGEWVLGAPVGITDEGKLVVVARDAKAAAHLQTLAADIVSTINERSGRRPIASLEVLTGDVAAFAVAGALGFAFDRIQDLEERLADYESAAP